MHFADMGTSSMMAAGSHVRAVGWLDARHAFPTGRLDAAVVDRIGAFANSWRLSVVALEWPCAAGSHTCELCGSFESSGNLGVPAGEILFVCPEMIAHYVGAHDYVPPKEFVEAINRAPLPGSAEYTAAVSRFRTER
jgi:hypothetical protein